MIGTRLHRTLAYTNLKDPDEHATRKKETGAHAADQQRDQGDQGEAGPQDHDHLEKLIRIGFLEETISAGAGGPVIRSGVDGITIVSPCGGSAGG